MEDLEKRMDAHSTQATALNTSMRAKANRMKKLEELLRRVDTYREFKPVYDELNGIKWKGRRQKFQTEHEHELSMFYMARRELDKHRSPAGKIPAQAWQQELAKLRQEYMEESERYGPIWDDLKKLARVKSCVVNVLHQQDQAQEKRQEVER